MSAEHVLLPFAIGAACAVVLELTFAYERWRQSRIRRPYTKRGLRR